MQDCLKDRDLCPFYRGDSVPFEFNFELPDGSPLDISGKTMFFAMRVDIVGSPITFTTLVTFPPDANSAAGKGWLNLDPANTAGLVAETMYRYEFQMVDGPAEVYTVGAGKVYVKQDMITRTV